MCSLAILCDKSIRNLLSHCQPGGESRWKDRDDVYMYMRGRDRHRQWPKRYSVLLDVIGLRGSHVNSRHSPWPLTWPSYVRASNPSCDRSPRDDPLNRRSLSRRRFQEGLLRAEPPVDLRGIPRSVRENKGLLPRWPARGRWSFVCGVSRESCTHECVRIP